MKKILYFVILFLFSSHVTAKTCNTDEVPKHIETVCQFLQKNTFEEINKDYSTVYKNLGFDFCGYVPVIVSESNFPNKVIYNSSRPGTVGTNLGGIINLSGQAPYKYISSKISEDKKMLTPHSWLWGGIKLSGNIYSLLCKLENQKTEVLLSSIVVTAPIVKSPLMYSTNLKFYDDAVLAKIADPSATVQSLEADIKKVVENIIDDEANTEFEKIGIEKGVLKISVFGSDVRNNQNSVIPLIMQELTRSRVADISKSKVISLGIILEQINAAVSRNPFVIAKINASEVQAVDTKNLASKSDELSSELLKKVNELSAKLASLEKSGKITDPDSGGVLMKFKDWISIGVAVLSMLISLFAIYLIKKN